MIIFNLKKILSDPSISLAYSAGIAKTFKKKKELKTMNDNPEEFALENRYEPDYGDPMDYKE